MIIVTCDIAVSYIQHGTWLKINDKDMSQSQFLNSTCDMETLFSRAHTVHVHQVKQSKGVRE